MPVPTLHPNGAGKVPPSRHPYCPTRHPYKTFASKDLVKACLYFTSKGHCVAHQLPGRLIT